MLTNTTSRCYRCGRPVQYIAFSELLAYYFYNRFKTIELIFRDFYTELMSFKIKKISLLFLFLFFFFSPSFVFAAPSHDHNNGVWIDNFADNTGLSAKSNMNVDISDGKLKLTNSSGGFAPPYNTSGYARSTSIIPLLIAQWNEATFSATIPEGTTLTIQILDEAAPPLAQNVPPQTASALPAKKKKIFGAFSFFNFSLWFLLAI